MIKPLHHFYILESEKMKILVAAICYAGLQITSAELPLGLGLETTAPVVATGEPPAGKIFTNKLRNQGLS